jgi:hypothetical protein
VSTVFKIPDGLIEIRDAIPDAIKVIAKTARWVHPETFRALPLWYPEFARGAPLYDASWSRQYFNGIRKQHKVEGNVQAAKALVSALGTKKVKNWTVCHIWGYDDPNFSAQGSVVRDRRFYSCVGNMIWLPTPLKGFTDAVPEIKFLLRTCAFHLYGWVYEHGGMHDEVKKIKSGHLPEGYPTEWPTTERRIHPPGTAPYSDRVVAAIKKRKSELRHRLESAKLQHYPRDEVINALGYWNIRL